MKPKNLGGKGRFVGWNGEQDIKSSHDILEEALLVPDSWRFNKTKLIRKAGYHSKSFYLGSQSEMTRPVILSYPLGRCMSINPPSQKDVEKMKPNLQSKKLMKRFIAGKNYQQLKDLPSFVSGII